MKVGDKVYGVYSGWDGVKLESTEIATIGPKTATLALPIGAYRYRRVVPLTELNLSEAAAWSAYRDGLLKQIDGATEKLADLQAKLAAIP